MKFLLILLTALLPMAVVAQKCNCIANFDYTVKAVTENYAGYNDKVTFKNSKEFQKFTKRLREQSMNAQNLDSCYINIKTWISYFKDNHLRVQLDWKYRKKNPEAANKLNKRFEKVDKQPRTEKLGVKTAFSKLDGHTLLMRFPSFQWREKGTIDSLLKAYGGEISETSNWIIDLRGNGGGTDYAYEGLSPFIYSNKVIVRPDEYLSSIENIRILESSSQSNETSQDSKIFLGKVITLMKQHPSQFVNPSGQEYFEISRDSVYKYPSKVAILIDRNTASSAESFLLMAMQSKKVKVYGENSGGMLDYSNTQFFDIPCEDLNLVIPIARSKRLPKNPIDNIGISPNIRIGGEVPDQVMFIRKLMDK